MTTHQLVAYGTPGPQGSKDAVGRRRNGSTIMIESSRKVKPWRAAVEKAARLYVETHPGEWPITEPVSMRMVFTVALPASAPKTTRTVPGVKPDLSKYARATEDSLTDAGLFKDDGLVVEYTRLAKVYPGEDPESLDGPGVFLEVTPVDVLSEAELLGLTCEACGGYAPRHRCRKGGAETRIYGFTRPLWGLGIPLATPEPFRGREGFGGLIRPVAPHTSRAQAIQQARAEHEHTRSIQASSARAAAREALGGTS